MNTRRNRSVWSRDELVVVLGLYFRLPRAKFDAATPEVIEVARLIDRTPAAVAKRLANYRFLDDGTGLAHGGTHARKLWEDLGGNRAQVSVEAARARERLLSSPKESTGMPKYQPGDFVKVEFRDEASGESEWMWVQVESCDDERRILLGRLDNAPVVLTRTLKLGSEIAVSYDNVREHRRLSEFPKQ